MGLDEFVERLAFEQLHGHKQGVAVPIEIVHRDYVGVGEGVGLGGLLLQGNEGVWVLFKILVEHLGGYVGVGVFRFYFAQVAGFIHCAHAAAAKHFFQHKAFLSRVPLVARVL